MPGVHGAGRGAGDESPEGAGGAAERGDGAGGASGDAGGPGPGGRGMTPVAAPLRQAYRDWMANRAYWARTHYRLKRGVAGPRSVAAPWRGPVMRLYGRDIGAFHRAAHLWAD